MWNLGGLYRKRHITWLETFYLINLSLLAGWNEYVSSSQSRLILTYILVVAALLVFVATVIHCVVVKIVTITRLKKSAGGKNKDGQEAEDDGDSIRMQHLESLPAPNVSAQNHSVTCVMVTGNQQPLTKLLGNDHDQN